MFTVSTVIFTVTACKSIFFLSVISVSLTAPNSEKKAYIPVCWWVSHWFGYTNLILENLISISDRRSLSFKFIWQADWLIDTDTHAGPHACIHTQTHTHNHIHKFKIQCMTRRLKMYWWVDWLALSLIQKASSFRSSFVIFGK